MYSYFVTSGDLKKTISHDSPEQAAFLFLETEDGPFGIIMEVSWHSEDTKRLRGARFFHTKTLLKEIEDHNERLLTFSQENV